MSGGGESSPRGVSFGGQRSGLGMKTQFQSRPSTTPMVITGAWLTAIIRGGTDISDISTITPEEIDAVRNGAAEIVGDTSTELTVRRL